MHANVWLFTVNDPPSIINCLCCVDVYNVKEQTIFVFFIFYGIFAQIALYSVAQQNPEILLHIFRKVDFQVNQSRSMFLWLHNIIDLILVFDAILNTIFVNSLRSPLFRPLYVFSIFFSTFQSFDSTTFDKFKLLKCLSTTCYYCL